MLNKSFTVLLFAALAGCGVKGQPLPPVNPPPLGRGEPTYSEVTRKKSGKKANTNRQDEEDSSAVEEK